MIHKNSSERARATKRPPPHTHARARPQCLLAYEADDSEELVDLCKLTEGKDWKLEEHRAKRKRKEKVCTRAAPDQKEQLRARDMVGRDVDVLANGKWRRALVNSFSAETMQVPPQLLLSNHLSQQVRMFLI